MRHHAAVRTEHTFEMLEVEAKRLSEAKAAVELERDKLQMELFDLRSAVEGEQYHLSQELRSLSHDNDAKNRMVIRLTAELDEMHVTQNRAERRALELETEVEVARHDAASARTELESNAREIQRLESQAAVLKEKVAKIEGKLADSRAKERQRGELTRRVMRVLSISRLMCDDAQQWARDCAVHNYFAIRSQKVRSKSPLRDPPLIDPLPYSACAGWRHFRFVLCLNSSPCFECNLCSSQQA